ncbi:hypothetical protein [Parapedobacter koreensis]|nr:hypothetical protein [Parapedobacter koreensis]
MALFAAKEGYVVAETTAMIKLPPMRYFHKLPGMSMLPIHAG